MLIDVHVHLPLPYGLRDRLDLAEPVKENLLGEAARRSVESFKPGFFASTPALAR